MSQLKSKTHAAAERRGGLLQDAIRAVESSISEYQLSKAGSELDERISNMEQEIQALSSEGEENQEGENDQETIASRFRSVWNKAIMLSEFASTPSQTSQVRSIFFSHNSYCRDWDRLSSISIFASV